MLNKQHGHNTLDIDIRFLLANERTLLAWIRTCLALEAGGIALLHFDKKNTALGVVIVGVGVVTASIGYVRFKAANRSIRSGRLPADSYGPEVAVVGVILIAVMLLLTNLQ